MEKRKKIAINPTEQKLLLTLYKMLNRSKITDNVKFNENKSFRNKFGSADNIPRVSEHSSQSHIQLSL